METKVIKININDGIEKYAEATEILKADGVVGMPTETVYGLAGNAFSPDAVNRIFEAKGRPTDNPLIVHISEFSQIYELVENVPDSAVALAERFWPGPLTIILPKSPKVPYCTTGNLDTVAVRLPSHYGARRLIEAAGFPLAAPSANLSGKPSPTCAEHVYEDLKGRIPLIIDGGASEEGVESTVITLAGEVPCLLRPGNVTIKELKSVLGQVTIADAVLTPLGETEKAASPGMKYVHYSPDADIVLVKGSYNAFCEFVNSVEGDGVYAMIFDGDDETDLEKPVIKYGFEDYKALARSLFASLRELDKKGAGKCFVRYPDECNEDNLAVLNRLLRAAGFNVIEV